MPFILYRTREAPVVAPLDNLNPKKGCCKYPIGDPHQKDFRFCNDPLMSKGPYCEHHSAICYVSKMTVAEAKAAKELRRKMGLKSLY